MGSNPSEHKGRNKPVEQINLDDIQEFIKRLNQNEGHSRYRLPTDEEWEYSAKAGSTTKYYFGDDHSQLGEYAWYRGNSRGITHPVGLKLPNAWGFHDMLGNVHELVSGHYYTDSPAVDTQGPPSGYSQVCRGGSCDSSYDHLYVFNRKREIPQLCDKYIGFRLALSSEEANDGNSDAIAPV
jgi:formylglycine-generating enzyme required for sulfatase activity